ncbi:ABC transporter substrate-binding protein [Gleimia hominis]|uniref:ABC transporter substrate-binding protein n=1 Tax=Gleimia hominis TaxID=595468 RepID=UPI000C7FBB06|nr:ABC transporter substrate-binding protein [Gleimia hominis]WIK65079.1 ABC transporter substrate-binding protein [Gleimia hominis]
MGFLRRKTVAALVAGFSLLIAGCTASTGGEPASKPADKAGGGSPVTVGMTYIPNVQFAPAYVADKEGLFTAEGVAAKLRHHGTDEGLFTALLAGEEDVVIASADEMLQARAQGMDLISVGQYYQKYPTKIMVKDDSAIRSVADLKGKKVGLPGEFGSNWFGLLAALKDSGMTRADIDVQSIGFTQLAALKSDKVDAVVGFSNNDGVQFELADVPVREIDLAKTGEPPLVGMNIVTSSQFAKNHADALKHTLQALSKGMQVCVDDPARAVDITKSYDQNLTSDEALASAKATLEATNKLFAPAGKVDFTQDVDQWKRMNDFLSQIEGVLGSKVDVTEAVTNDYLEQ